MSFVPPPFGDDVDDDFGPYSRDEIIVARTSLLHSVQQERTAVWQRIKSKLGILPNGQRLRTYDSHHVWLPNDIPRYWSAPVALHDPEAEMSKTGSLSPVEKEEREENSFRQNEQSQGRISKSASASAFQGSAQNLDGSETKRKCYEGKTTMIDCSSKSTAQEYSSQQPPPSSSDQSPCTSGSKSDFSGRSNVSEPVMPQSSEGKHEGTGCKKRKLDKRCSESSGKYEVVFQCDLCSHSCMPEESMMRHLRRSGHYSASRCLSSGRDALTGKLVPEYLSCASALKMEENLFKHKVPICTECSEVFPDVSKCVEHSASAHQQEGAYSLQPVIKSGTLQMNKSFHKCIDCGLRFSRRDLQRHIHQTKHMDLYFFRKSHKKQIFFVCQFCKLIHINYFSYKHHVYQVHAKEVGQSEVITGTYFTISRKKRTQHLLPDDSGIPDEMINFDFSKGDPNLSSEIAKRSDSENKNITLKHMANAQTVKNVIVKAKEVLAIKKKKKDRTENKKQQKRLAARRKR